MYHRLARTERYRWWKPLVELVLFVLVVLVLWILVATPLWFALGDPTDGATGMIMLGLEFGGMIPAAFLAARLAGRPWRALLAVGGRLRRGWLTLCLVTALAKVVAQFAVEAAVDALGHPVAPPRDVWIGWAAFAPLAIAACVAVPLQAAAEEVVCRGTLLQALGAWVRAPWFAILLSSVVFGLGHGLGPAVLAWATTFGVVAAWLTVRTGGLEAAIALHVLQNVSWFLAEAANGRADRWITEVNADVGWGAVLVDLPLTVLYAVAIAAVYSRRAPALRAAAVEPPPLPRAVDEADQRRSSATQDCGYDGPT